MEYMVNLRLFQNKRYMKKEKSDSIMTYPQGGKEFGRAEQSDRRQQELELFSSSELLGLAS